MSINYFLMKSYDYAGSSVFRAICDRHKRQALAEERVPIIVVPEEKSLRRQEVLARMYQVATTAVTGG
jgi:hypothetical protein